MLKSAVFATTLKEFVIITGLLLIALVIVKVIIAIRNAKRTPDHQDLIDKGIYPTIRKDISKKLEAIDGHNLDEVSH